MDFSFLTLPFGLYLILSFKKKKRLSYFKFNALSVDVMTLRGIQFNYILTTAA